MALFHYILLLIVISQLNGISVINSSPPRPNETAKMARYVIHNSEWISVATISQISGIQAYPFANLKSMSDGPDSNGTGMPYLYMSPLDFTGIDVKIDNRITMLASLAESDYCKQENFDPQDPRCARIIITGRLVKVDNTTDEFQFAKNSLFERHPAMKYWPIDHNWFIAKPDIELIIVLDFFGGAKYVTVEDYFKANLNSPLNNFIFENIEVIDVYA